MNANRFPYPGALSLAHMVFATLFSSLLYRLRPSLFTFMSENSSKISGELIVKGAFPIAFAFSTQLVLSNAAYLHCSVAFLQMMKESNLVWVYILSLLAAVELFNARNAAILAMTFLATSLSVHGEIHYSAAGFTMQATSQLFESSKIVLQSILLNPARGWKLDPLSYTLVVMPLCAICLCFTLSTMVVFWPSRPKDFFLPDAHALQQWSPYILANCCVAFTLNIVVAAFVRSSGAVAFILAGVIKDVMIVSCSSLVLGETVSGTQVVAFSLQMMLVATWSFMKSMPDQFHDGFLTGLYDLWIQGGIQKQKDCSSEKVRLLKDHSCEEKR
jgi:hypothetical protein